MADNNNLEELAKDILETEDETAQHNASDIEQNKVLALLSYIFILFLVPLFAAPNSKFARYHANQGLVLFIVDVVVGAVIGIVCAIIGAIPAVGGIIAGIISGVLGLVLLALMILGIVNAVTGKAKALPLIGRIKIIK